MFSHGFSFSLTRMQWVDQRSDKYISTSKPLTFEGSNVQQPLKICWMPLPPVTLVAFISWCRMGRVGFWFELRYLGWIVCGVCSIRLHLQKVLTAKPLCGAKHFMI